MTTTISIHADDLRPGDLLDGAPLTWISAVRRTYPVRIGAEKLSVVLGEQTIG